MKQAFKLFKLFLLNALLPFIAHQNFPTCSTTSYLSCFIGRHHRAVTRDKIYKTVARQLHGVVPCWVCGEQVALADATLEHIKPRSEGGNSHVDNLAISHDACNNRCHARGLVPSSPTLK